MRVSPIYNWPASAIACSVAFPRALSTRGIYKMFIRRRVYHPVSAYFFADYRIRNNAKDYVGWATRRGGQPIGVIIRSVLSTRNRRTPWETHLAMCTYTSTLLKTLLCTGSLTSRWSICRECFQCT